MNCDHCNCVVFVGYDDANGIDNVSFGALSSVGDVSNDACLCDDCFNELCDLVKNFLGKEKKE